MIGKTIGHYKILSQLGSGGMGVVYEAEDTTLGRHVALKFLPDEYSHNPASLERFLREARSASALNHPNICTVYAAEEHGGTWMIAMELLEGSTLGHVIGNGGLSTDRILDIGIQVSDALDVAHAHGIVHRDIKPANIFLTRKNAVKVLDFGLAKFATDRRAVAQTFAATSSEPPSYLTSPGMAVGTAAYMSPEQARGEELDGRSDLFSFGSVLYEMCTGRVPFEGATSPVIFAGILDRDPAPPEQINPQLPPKLAEIICKSLEKDRDLRYQTAAELRGDFKRLRRDTSGRSAIASTSPSSAATAAFAAAAPSSRSTPQATPVAQPAVPSSTTVLIAEAKRHKFGVVIAFAFLLLLSAAVGWALWSQLHKPAPRVSAQQMSIERLTSAGKIEGSASISPDGKYVIYEMVENGKRSLWLRQIATSSSVKLLPDSDVDYRGTTFSPDGNYVYFTWNPDSEPKGALYVVPTLGGTPRKILSDIESPITFSPDGLQFAFVRNSAIDASVSLIIANTSDGSVGRSLVSTKIAERWFSQYGPSWSPDGKLIAIGMYAIENGVYHQGIAAADMNGNLNMFVPNVGGSVGRVSWLNDGSGVVYTASLHVTDDNKQIFRAGYPSGEITRITNDLNGYGTVSFGITADNCCIATIQSTTNSDVFLADANGGSLRQVSQETLGGNSGLTASGTKFAYTTGGSSVEPIWIADETGGTPVQANPARDSGEMPSIAPDQKHIAYLSFHDNKVNVWVSDIDGSNPRPLTATNTDLGPTFTDPETVYFTHYESGKPYLYKASLGGGAPAKVSDNRMETLIASHKGDRLLAFAFDPSLGRFRHAIIDLQGKALSFFDFPATSQSGAWAADDSGIVYINTVNRVSNLWKIDLNGKNPEQLTHFDKGLIFNFAYLADGKLVLARGDSQSDAILIRNFR